MNPQIQDHLYLLAGIIGWTGLIVYSIVSGRISYSPVSPIFSKRHRPDDFRRALWVYVFILTLLIGGMLIGW